MVRGHADHYTHEERLQQDVNNDPITIKLAKAREEIRSLESSYNASPFVIALRYASETIKRRKHVSIVFARQERRSVVFISSRCRTEKRENEFWNSGSQSVSEEEVFAVAMFCFSVRESGEMK